MKIHRYQIVSEQMMDLQWRGTALLWLRPGPIADVAIKSLVYYSTEAICVEEANKLLTELGITMNKNQKRRKAENPGAHQPRKSTKPKVGGSAAEITRRIQKERGS